MLNSHALADNHPQVRLAALLLMADLPAGPDAGPALHAALTTAANSTDPVLRDALTAAVVRHEAAFGRAVLQEKAVLPPGAGEVVRRLAHHIAAGAPEYGPGVVGQLGEVPTGTAEAILAEMAAGWPDGQRPKFDAAVLGPIGQRLSPVAQADFLGLAQKWGALAEFPELVTQVIRTTLSTVGQADAPAAARVSAARSLLRLADSEANVATVLRHITPTSPPELATGPLESLGSSRAPGTGATLLAAWKNFTPLARRTAIAPIAPPTRVVERLAGCRGPGRVAPHGSRPPAVAATRPKPASGAVGAGS